MGSFVRRLRRRAFFRVAAAVFLAAVALALLPRRSRRGLSYYELQLQSSSLSQPFAGLRAGEAGLDALLEYDHSLSELRNSQGPQPVRFVRVAKTDSELKRNTQFQKYFKDIWATILANKPRVGFELAPSMAGSGMPLDVLVRRESGAYKAVNIAMHDTAGTPLLSEEYLLNCLKVPPEMVADLAASHKNVVRDLPAAYPEGLYEGAGIVFIGGGKFSWLSLLGIQNLRATGSKLPVELIFPTEAEYEEMLCEKVLPDLDARCVLLTERVPELRKHKYTIRGYQYKSMALLVSSFERVLFLDSDNVPVANPDAIFVSEPFTSHGMVTWPDFWRRVTHPTYYKLVDRELSDEQVRNNIDDVTPNKYYARDPSHAFSSMPLHDRAGALPDPSSESGQIAVDKRTHIRALLLALYYNYYGPQQYYPLFSQGGAGEGDKETFVAAAQHFGLPFYHVRKAVDVIGYWQLQPEEHYTGVGMIQYDPVVDYKLVAAYKDWFSAREREHERRQASLVGRWRDWLSGDVVYDPARTFTGWFNKTNSRPMFVHSNFPKLDPVSLRKDDFLFVTSGGARKRVRMYSDQSGLDFDFELRQWQFIKKYFCDRAIDLNYLRVAGVTSLDYCDFIEQELEFLESTQHLVNVRNATTSEK
ncbi:hypothetical protein KL924_002502 [Ogataea haglerorum]|nr:hypothetical protein KL924_002502 [Ogataea haglerorum]